MDYIRYYDSRLGRILLVSDGKALTGLRFDDRIPGRPESRLPVFDEAERWLDLYFGGKDPRFTPKLRPAGTPFQKTVWEILAAVPYGQTVTYGEVARQAAVRMKVPRMSAQAAGSAVGRNPVLLMIPCHRVIGTDGSLRGYAGGLWRKKSLLETEQA